jgi:phosphoglycolate phosphatase-like HAD superfamily hydrolase
VAPQRILLFDVDQTLLWSGGAGSRAMRETFEQLYGIADGFRGIEFSGRTDVAIVRDAMREHGVLDGRPEDFPPELARFQQAYYALLPAVLQQVEGGRVLPGVRELLDALAARRDAARTGLATGNFRQAALMKLRHFRLDHHLDEGGFADDAEDRGELVGIAIRRVAGGEAVAPADVWVIGDTPLDIAAARANGARALAVATGASSAADLRAAGADEAVDDLSDTARVLELLLG